jgi:hypothetical protein
VEIRVVSIRKNNNKLSSSTTIANQLTHMVATRVFGKERKLGQYKLENTEIIYFRNFKDLRFYSDFVLYNKNKHIILTRDDKS